MWSCQAFESPVLLLLHSVGQQSQGQLDPKTGGETAPFSIRSALSSQRMRGQVDSLVFRQSQVWSTQNLDCEGPFLLLVMPAGRALTMCRKCYWEGAFTILLFLFA